VCRPPGGRHSPPRRLVQGLAAGLATLRTVLDDLVGVGAHLGAGPLAPFCLPRLRLARPARRWRSARSSAWRARSAAGSRDGGAEELFEFWPSLALAAAVLPASTHENVTPETLLEVLGRAGSGRVVPRMTVWRSSKSRVGASQQRPLRSFQPNVSVRFSLSCRAGNRDTPSWTVAERSGPAPRGGAWPARDLAHLLGPSPSVMVVAWQR
jgi:hypothetical protein